MSGDNEIYGCAYGCPKQKRSWDCPFNEIENFSFKERVFWIQSLSKEERESIIEHHRFCTLINSNEF